MFPLGLSSGLSLSLSLPLFLPSPCSSCVCLHSLDPERKFLSVFVNDKLIYNSSTRGPFHPAPVSRATAAGPALIGRAEGGRGRVPGGDASPFVAIEEQRESRRAAEPRFTPTGADWERELQRRAAGERHPREGLGAQTHVF